jgi:Cys-rich protein (TIGR01571 family)
MALWACCVPFGCLCMQTLDAKLVTPEDSKAPIIACLCSWGLCCFGAAYNRYILRSKLGLEGNILIDLVLEFLCCFCAVSQEWREVMRHKGKLSTTPIWEVLK